MATRKAISLALGTVLLASIAVSSGPAEARPDTSSTAKPDSTMAPATRSAGEVTLITGDRVRVSSDGTATIIAHTRPGLRFSTYQRAGHTNVVPSDAAPLLAAGVLDERLFDITTLLEAGYDSRRGSLPLIVVPDEKGRSALAAKGVRITRELPAVHGVALESSHANPLWTALTVPAAYGRSLRPGISHVWLDGQRRVVLDQSVPQVGAPAAWAAGYPGTGAKVAIVDTGIDSTHPDLAGKVIAAQNFTTEPDTLDRNGHGTHVASTVAGTGAASGGLYKGVAPGASLLSAKVCTEGGSCTDSAILAGMNWAASQGADVVNMSLGGVDLAGADPLEQAVNNLTASSGTLFVIAAGNSPAGAGDYSLSSPGAADAALTVGAVDSTDTLAYFSNKGPRVGDAALKPDITAPGVDITAARSSTSSLPGGSYTDLSGTSMATPHVAGAAAILVQRRPTWTPAQLKAGLMASAGVQAGTGVFGQGAGRLRVDQEINQTVLVNPPSISLGRQVAPHSDDPVLTRTVQYQNTGTSAVSLTLTLNAQDPFGSPAPAGMFALSTGTVNVPAGGAASVTLTTDTRVAGPEGMYGGWIAATGGSGSISVSTPFGVHRADGAEITFHLRNRAGQYSPNSEIMMIPVSGGAIVHQWSLPDEPITLWVPSGVYIVKAMLPEDPDLVGGATVMINARMVVNTSTPTTQNLDAAGGALINVTVPNPSAVTEVTEVDGQLTEAGVAGLVGHSFVGSPVPIYTKQWGATTATGFITKLRRQMAVPGPIDVGYNQPIIYNMAWFPTTFPTGWTRSMTTAQLATVNASFWAHVPGALGGKGQNAQPASGLFPISLIAQGPFNAPFTRTEYYNTESGVRWQSYFTDYLGPTFTPYIDSESAPVAFTAGTTTNQTWNKPVYGPALGALMRPENHVTRNGDIIQLYPPMFGDSEGHAGNPVVGASGTLTFKRGTEVLGTWAYPNYPPSVWALVPPEQNTYTLEATASRGAPAVLSTQVSAVWTFKSATVPWNQYTRLPLWFVLFKPNVNASNSSPAGTTFDIPLTAAAQPTSSPGTLSGITVQYSTNDGSTWSNATLSGFGANRTARVTHPGGSGFVSLRVTVTDSAGNAVTQTVIRAYRFG